MTSRRNRVSEADRRARRQLAAVLDDAHERRLMSGIHQADVSSLLGCSRSWVGTLERGEVGDVGVVQLARLCAAVGLDLSVRTFEGGSVLRDAGQVKLLNRLRSECHASLSWRLEVFVAPGDQRAFDALIGMRPRISAVEAITRLRDGQAQVRIAQAKQEAADIASLILLIAGTNANRRAVREAGSQLRDAFPLSTKAVLTSLRRGEVPDRNGIVLM
ncbi:MAG: helix-turn-helix domain-containing protein [Candidatus Limnocylindria bacterium]